MTNLFRIPAVNFEKLESRIARLAARAEKLGCTGVKVDVVDRKREPVKKNGTTIGHRDYVYVRVEGEAPRIPGYRLVAVVEPLGEGTNLVLGVPGNDDVEVPDEFRTSAIRCDHCELNRNRAKGYAVLREADGEVSMVGRNCLRDFTGHEDPEAVAKACDLLCSLEETLSEPNGGWGTPLRFLDLEGYLLFVDAAVSRDGWVSRSAARADARLVATADVALNAVNPTSEYDRKLRDELEERITDECRERVRRAIEWAREDLDAKSDFFWNLKVVAEADAFPVRRAGIAAYLIVAWDRELERAAKRARRVADSEHFGTPKERAEFTLTVTRAHGFSTAYGWTTAFSFLDESGNEAVWFSSGRDPGLEVGNTYKVRATVKKHDTYKGVAQTVLSRVSVLEEIDSE